MPPPPFTPSASAQPSSQTEVRVHVRAPGGHLEIEGVSITSRVNDFPALRPGQRLVIFALYNPYRAAWQVHLTGVFEVAPGGLRPLSKDPDTGEFETVDALGQAIAKASAGGLVR